MPSLDELINNPEFRQRLIADPETVVREAGVDLPDSVKLVVHEDSANEVHLVLGDPTAGLPEMVRQLLAKAQHDAAFKARLISDPITTARVEFGFTFPTELKLCIHENTAGIVHLVLPSAEASEGEIPDFQLEAVAGGMSAVQKRDFINQAIQSAIRQSRQVGLSSRMRDNRR